MKQENIRNFSIIAHIDHGKSTLADRILEKTNAVSSREMKEQLLDSMELERERGITIKLNAVQVKYNQNNEDYYFHLIDTPGHVDFTYEVSRSLAACEGAILVVDAAQGIEAQTIANTYLAIENDLKIIPVINKIDLPNADIEKVTKEITKTFGFKEENIIKVSAKTGEGIDLLLETIVKEVPSPKGSRNNKLKALIFDSFFDTYRGVIANVKIVEGTVKKGDSIKMMNSKAIYEVIDLGINSPKAISKKELVCGEVGYINGSIKDIGDVMVGDTITLENNPADQKLPGYKEIKPMVFCGLYPIDSSKFNDLRDALNKLKLNDASLTFEPETSTSLGFGFRCGFLGMLHLEIIKERIQREFKIDMIATSPSVIYEVKQTDHSIILVDNPSKMPDKTKIVEVKEPYIKTNILLPNSYVGPVMELCENKRGNYKMMEYLDGDRVNIHYEIPLSEIVYDFFDKLKSTTKGYASFDYELIGYKPSNLTKMDILLNGEVVDALSVIVHKDFAYKIGKNIVEKLKDIIPRQMFQVPIQATIGTKVIARADISALRKNVLAKCYGGDVSRKRKLLEKQKEGKKKMKQIGKVEIPDEAFLLVLKNDE